MMGLNCFITGHDFEYHGTGVGITFNVLTNEVLDKYDAEIYVCKKCFKKKNVRILPKTNIEKEVDKINWQQAEEVLNKQQEVLNEI